MMVISPSNASPGMNLQIVPPKSYIPKRKRDIGQKFEVRVPEYCEPGDSFALLANGVRVLVQCPENATGGQMVRFQLPFRTKGLVFKKLEYDCDGWARTLQITQMKFQWYVDCNGVECFLFVSTNNVSKLWLSIMQGEGE